VAQEIVKIMKSKVLKIRVRGRVQGVGYRRFAQRKANDCGVFGWARNLYNGEVEVLAVGQDSALEQYLEHLRQGPSFGQVEGLTSEIVTDEKIDAKSDKKYENLNEFLILPDGELE
jgi:acylphosphatase